MMSYKKKVARFIEKKREQIQRGREVTMQMKAEKARRKMNRLSNMPEGARKSLVTSIHAKTPVTGVWSQVMKPELERRRYEREKRRS
jgi:hypothetical protein